MTEKQIYVITVWGYEKHRIDDQIAAAKVLAKTIKAQDQRPVWLLFASDLDSNKTFDSNIDRVITTEAGASISYTIGRFVQKYDSYEFLFLSPTMLVLFDLTHLWHSFRHDHWVIPANVKDHRNNKLNSSFYYKEQKVLKEENLIPCHGFPCYIKTTDEIRQVLLNISVMSEVWPEIKKELYGNESKLNQSWNYFTSFVYSTSDYVRKDPSLDIINMSRRDQISEDVNWSKRSWIEFLNYYLIPGRQPTVKIENYIQLGIVEYDDLNLTEKLVAWAEKS